jgi:branched-chain amino acid transport system permease protein
MLLMGPAVVAIAMVAKGGYGSSLAWLRRPPPSASSSALPAGGESKTDRRPPDALAKEASV